MSQHTTQVLEGCGKFASNFYQIVSRTPDNVICSPSSVHAVLAMAHQGASGTTLKAFETTLQVPNTEVAAAGYNNIMEQLNNAPDVALLIANKIYSMQGFELKESFRNTVENNFKSEIQSIDFAKSSEAAGTINGWVSEKTKEKIKNLINEKCLDASTRLVLVNAIYFKGDWASPFSKLLTIEKPFNINKQDTINVQMMQLNKKFMYKNEPSLDAKILRMPYTNKNLSMIFVLPNKTDGLKDLHSKLVSYNIENLTNNLEHGKVEVSLPKFKIEATISLVDLLKEMGLPEIFDSSKADFSNIATNDEKLYVSEVIQKAFIEVNEEGAEAAAATGMVMMTRCMPMQIPPEPFIFNADHPFVFYLIHENEGPNNVLFVGHITKPTCD